jgi:hypothetical protein
MKSISMEKMLNAADWDRYWKGKNGAKRAKSPVTTKPVGTALPKRRAGKKTALGNNLAEKLL